MTVRKTRLGFTLVEMLVVITIIGILAALLLPALSAARESARNQQCKTNLKNFYVGLDNYANKDPRGRYCSGAYDWERDGCIDTYGWVADMVNTGICLPQELLCPSNSAKGSEKLNPFFGTTTISAAEINKDAAKLAAGICKDFGTFDTTSGAYTAGSTYSDAAAQGQAVAEHLLKKGYGTNYASSWFLVRGAPALTRSGNDLELPVGTAVKSLNGSSGPISRSMLEAGAVPSSLVPLLFDAAIGDVKDGVLKATIPGYMQLGDRLVESFSDGPAVRYTQGTYTPATSTTPATGTPPSSFTGWAKVTAALKIVTDDGSINVIRDEQPSPGGVRKFENLQDWRDMGPVHGVGKGGSCNILMADGSIKQFTDVNGDGYLNPGFDPSAASGANLAQYGYTDSTVELPEDQVFSGVFIQKAIAKANLD